MNVQGFKFFRKKMNVRPMELEDIDGILEVDRRISVLQGVFTYRHLKGEAS